MEEKRKSTEKICGFFLKWFAFTLGIKSVHVERQKCEKLYKEIFGDDYNFTYDEGYSTIISNHTGWVDIIVYLHRFAPGFIAKNDVKNIPLVGKVAEQIECLFVDRDDANNRNATVK